MHTQRRRIDGNSACVRERLAVAPDPSHRVSIEICLMERNSTDARIFEREIYLMARNRTADKHAERLILCHARRRAREISFGLDWAINGLATFNDSTFRAPPAATTSELIAFGKFFSPRNLVHTDARSVLIVRRGFGISVLRNSERDRLKLFSVDYEEHMFHPHRRSPSTGERVCVTRVIMSLFCNDYKVPCEPSAASGPLRRRQSPFSV